jgi:hypothetical protein
MIVTPAGNLLVSEASTQPNAGRLSLVTPTGVRRTLIEGLPSGLEVAGGPSGPTAMVVRDQTLYLAIGGGDAERRGEAPGTAIHNPQGRSSALFASVLRMRFATDLDQHYRYVSNDARASAGSCGTEGKYRSATAAEPW